METCCGYGYDPARESGRLPRIFKGRRERTGHRKSRGALRGCGPYLRASRFQGVRPLPRKENSSRGPRRRLRVRLRRRTGRTRQRSPCSGSGILTRFPFEEGEGAKRDAPASERNSPISQDRLTHVQLLFTWNPSPLRPSRFSLEYLLLPPRSAPAAAPRGLAPGASALTAAALLLAAA